MLKSKKIAAVAGILGSFALIGVGAAQSFGADGPSRCADDGNGHVRCVQVSEYTVTTDKQGNVHVVNDSTQTCPSSTGEVNCVSTVTLSGKK
ncbi:hypothetical protein ABZ915_06365 [Streptomyces sp. NPDC046915]|uniref:hypothetical protein n=1 Tax=Streptomyces sp. NPDC046915 TaxID=3155257 RepID=UPI0033FF0671